MRWFTATLRWRVEPEPGSAEAPPVPGPGEPGTTPPTPAAEPSTPDRGGPPETIPYSRFKEVNDRLAGLRDFEPLVEAGYTPQDLTNLASFGLAYDADPVGTWARMGVGLDDLPQEVKDAIEQHVGSGGTQPEPAGDQQPKPDDSRELPPEIKFLMDREQSRIQAEQTAAHDEVLDTIINHWSEADKKDGLEIPGATKLTFISAALGSGGYDSPEQVAEMARQAYMAEREAILQSAVRRGPSPLPAPGSGVTPGTPVKFGDLRQASRAAEEAIRRGELQVPGLKTG